MSTNTESPIANEEQATESKSTFGNSILRNARKEFEDRPIGTGLKILAPIFALVAAIGAVFLRFPMAFFGAFAVFGVIATIGQIISSWREEPTEIIAFRTMLAGVHAFLFQLILGFFSFMGLIFHEVSVHGNIAFHNNHGEFCIARYLMESRIQLNHFSAVFGWQGVALSIASSIITLKVRSRMQKEKAKAAT